MNLKKFAEETRNTTELLVTEKHDHIKIEAYEVEFNHELEEVTADLQFIDNLQGKRIDELTIIVTEVGE